MATLVTETWTGTNGAAWPAQWAAATATGAAGAATIQGNLGQITPAAVSYQSYGEYLTGMTAAARTVITCDIGFTAVQEQYPAVAWSTTAAMRSASDAQPAVGYAAILMPSTNAVTFRRSGVQIGTDITYTFTSGSQVTVELDVNATTGAIAFRIWDTATGSRPGTAQFTYTDGSPIGGTGKVMLLAGNGTPSGSATFDNLTVTDGAATGPALPTHVATGTIVVGGTGFTPAYPAGIAAGDLLLLAIAFKPITGASPTITGWTKQVADTQVGTGAAGAGVGAIEVALYTKDTVSGSETGTVAVSPSPASNVVGGAIACYRSSTGTFSLDYATGTDTSSGTGFSATASKTLAETTNDRMFAMMVSSASTAHSAQAFTATGATYAAATERADVGSTTGDDIRISFSDAAVTAGPATAATVLAGTLAAASTGGAIFVRIRESSTNDYTASPVDSVGITDTAANVVAAVRAAADTVGVADAVASGMGLDRAQADNLGIADSVTSVAGYAAQRADPIGIGDTSAAVTDSARSAPDTVGISDTAIGASDLTRQQVDGVSIGDAATTAAGNGRAQIDTVGITDTAAPASDTLRASTDPVGITDSVTAAVNSARSIGDPLGLTDAPVQTADATRNPADGIAVLDGVALDATRAVSDPVGVIDGSVLGAAAFRSVDDAVGVADAAAPTLAGSGASTISDPTGVTDTATVTQAGARAQPDAVAITDGVAIDVGRTAIVGDALPIADASSLDRGYALPDPVNVADVGSHALDAARASADSVGITDSVIVGLVGAGAADLADSIGITDTASRGVGGARAQSDPVGLTDAVLAVLERIVTVSDLLGIIDAAQGEVTSASQGILSDGVALADDAEWTSTGQRQSGDSVGIADGVVAVIDVLRTLADLAAISDTAVGVADDAALDHGPTGMTGPVVYSLSFTGPFVYHHNFTGPVIDGLAFTGPEVY